MKETSSLAVIEKASMMLAKANTIQQAKELKDLMLTAADWAKRRGLGEEIVRRAGEYSLLAERKMGEMLAATERADGGPGPGRGKKVVTQSNHLLELPPTLTEIGLTKRESAAAQFLASLPEEKFDLIKTGEKTRTAIRREQHREAIEKRLPQKPTGKYRIIYADPPWKYGDQLTEAYGATRYHYPTMTISELCFLPVKDLSEDNAVLFMWVTSPILAECWPVIKAWGFQYRASFIWDKIKHNMGHYNSVRHEFLLLCIKGSCLPDTTKLIDSVQTIERKGHSEKPEEFRKIIEKLYTHGAKIELFAREDHAGWDVWGNEING